MNRRDFLKTASIIPVLGSIPEIKPIPVKGMAIWHNSAGECSNIVYVHKGIFNNNQLITDHTTTFWMIYDTNRLLLEKDPDEFFISQVPYDYEDLIGSYDIKMKILSVDILNQESATWDLTRRG